MSDIKAYRIVKKRWANSAFDGEGANLYGGRWNSKGISCVYVADTPSLAVLEVLVHLTSNDVMQSYAMYEIELPADLVLRAKDKSLPANWRAEPAPQETASFGDEWIESGVSLALAVPSVIVPMSWNYLMNINHPAFAAVVTKAKPVEFKFDQRLLPRPS
ncbi:RES family NAD+ phosphorylase [Pseudomonas serbica]|uniref:RES family NAD+ phosphorylase n=1 Tax=Pseudomonas serbica TaxID=2965074 RepID=UPI003CCEA475